MNLSLLTGRKNALFSVSCTQINGDGILLQVITVTSHSCTWTITVPHSQKPLKKL